MSHPQVALLRGINVGRAKRVAMADLRRVLSDLGFGQVRTLLNSGNAVFTSTDADPARSAAEIESRTSAELNVNARVIVLSRQEFARIVEENTLAEAADNPSRLQVAVLADPSDRSRLTSLLELDFGEEAFALGSRAAYMWCPAGMLESQLPELVGRALGDAVTTRNWSTLKKIEAVLEALEPR